MADDRLRTEGEPLITFAEARAQEPLSRLPRLSISTLFRWFKDGVCRADGTRVHLGAWFIGKRLFTTRSAIDEFLAAQGPARAPATPRARTAPPTRSRSTRRRERDRARARATAATI